MKRKLYVLVGGGGHANVVLRAAEAAGLNVQGYLAMEQQQLRVPYLGDDDAYTRLLQRGLDGFLFGVGSANAQTARIRAEIFERLALLGGEQPILVHPTASVAPSVKLGCGAIVLRAAVVGEDAVLGTNVLVNTGSIVDHDTRIGDHSHVAPGCVLSGGITVGSQCLIGAGSTVIQGIRIGDSAVVGAGSVVTHDVMTGATVVGAPAHLVPPATNASSDWRDTGGDAATPARQ